MWKCPSGSNTRMDAFFYIFSTIPFADFLYTDRKLAYNELIPKGCDYI